MNYRQTNSLQSPSQMLPSTDWMVILLFVFLSAVLIVAGQAILLNFAFPGMALLVGLYLYLRHSILYIGFTWWLWFLTPFVRRVVDYHGVFTDPAPILLAPILVTSITFLTLWRNLPQSFQVIGQPFLFCFLGIFYSFAIGIINNPIIPVILGLLDWLCPILFGFHLFVHWRDYPEYRQNCQKVFLWGTLIMGAYGVWQFLVAPDWDTLWLHNTQVTSFGRPRPLEIRVWSTMNGPQPFAATLVAGLILLLTDQSKLKFAATGFGYLAFLLSRARAPWLGWVAALLIFLPSLKSNLQMRIIVSIMIAATLVVPLVQMEPFAEVIGSRLETLASAEEDKSLDVRSQVYDRVLKLALFEVVGKGLGDQTLASALGNDGAIVPMLFSLGWIGSIPYIGGLILLLVNLFSGSVERIDPFASAARAIVIGTFSQVSFNFVIVAPIGIVLWSFLALNLAARRYHKYQATLNYHNY